MANKFTVAQIKDILNRAGDRSGFAFDKYAPYYVNAERLKAIKGKFAEMVERYGDAISAKQRASLNNWFVFLADRYGV